MIFIVDRFEGDIAVVEMDEGKMQSIPRAFLDPDCKEGDIYEINFLRKETLKREKKMQKLKDSLTEH